MTTFSLDYVKDLWNQMPEKTWNGLGAALEFKKKQGKELGGGVEDDLQKIGKDLKEVEKEFPKTPQELYDLFRQRLPGLDDSAGFRDNHLEK